MPAQFCMVVIPAQVATRMGGFPDKPGENRTDNGIPEKMKPTDRDPPASFSIEKTFVFVYRFRRLSKASAPPPSRASEVGSGVTPIAYGENESVWTVIVLASVSTTPASSIHSSSTR